MGTDGIKQPVVDVRVRDAFAQWASGNVGAPWDSGALITHAEVKDEVIERLVTQVVRRTIRETRTSSNERRPESRRLDPTKVDPFAFTNETLRVASQYVALCSSCNSSGVSTCPTCTGRGRISCRNCYGTGKQRSEKTGRPIQCKICKASGQVACGGCSGSGKVPCRPCAGSGHQLAWLEFETHELWLVNVAPESPVVIAHRSLQDSRFLPHEELADFTIVEQKESLAGPVRHADLAQPFRRLLEVQSAVVDPRTERIQAQQYYRLAVERRDVTYAMAGTSGTVVLSGKQLLGSTTADARKPIRRRLILWFLLAVVTAGVAFLTRAAFVGSSSYFDSAKLFSAVAAGTGAALAIPAMGIMLRSWRGGLQFRPLGATAIATGALAALCVAAVPAIGLATRPTAAEVSEDLKAGLTNDARAAIDGLKELSPNDSAVLGLEDQVMLAEAKTQSGQDRLKTLDAVAGRKGELSAEAATSARTERVAQIRGLIQGKDGDAALKALDEWFPKDESPEIMEERARAYEAKELACKTDTCRLAECERANTVRRTEARGARAADLKAKVLDSLATDKVFARDTLPRLQQIHQLSDIATDAGRTNTNDHDVEVKAAAAVAFVETERVKVPLVGADLAVVSELLGSYTKSDKDLPMISLDGVTAYLSVDKTGKCRGLFVVGSTSGHRSYESKTWPAERLLSQAVGRTTKIPQPSTGASTSRWFVGSVPVTARWRGTQLAELRIGDAQP